MSRKIPIIKIHGHLLVSIQIDLSDHLVSELKEDICADIQKHDPTGLIIEVSGVDILDSYIARSIREIAHIATLMGVKSVIAGLDPSMAITLVEMGMNLSDILTSLNLENAIDILNKSEKADEEEMVIALDEEEPEFDILGEILE